MTISNPFWSELESQNLQQLCKPDICYAYNYIGFCIVVKTVKPLERLRKALRTSKLIETIYDAMSIMNEVLSEIARNSMDKILDASKEIPGKSQVLLLAMTSENKR